MGFTNLKTQLKAMPGQSLAVAWGTDQDVLLACRNGLNQGFLREVVLTGPPTAIKEAAEECQCDLAGFKIEAAKTRPEGAALAVRLVKEGRCSLLMKGHLNSSTLMRAVLHKERGIRDQALLSHIGVIELPAGRLVLLTDGGMNIKPDLMQKSQILDNAIRFAWALDITYPKVAVLAALETVNPQMQETLDAAALSQMGARGQFSRPALVDGPLAFDNAYSKKAAAQKELDSPVAGQADILLVPEITTGNVLYKSFVYVGNFQTAGVIYGASCPIVLTSRSDSSETKLNAIAVACRALMTD